MWVVTLDMGLAMELSKCPGPGTALCCCTDLIVESYSNVLYASIVTTVSLVVGFFMARELSPHDVALGGRRPPFLEQGRDILSLSVNHEDMLGERCR